MIIRYHAGDEKSRRFRIFQLKTCVHLYVFRENTFKKLASSCSKSFSKRFGTTYSITFSEPQSYTLLQVKVDRFQGLALLGGLITLLGLILAFYLLPARAWAVRAEDGTWMVYGQSRKGGALFREEFDRAAQAEKGDAP